MTALTHLGSVDLGSRVSVAVARKTLDVAESQGEAMVDLIRQAGEVGRSALRVRPLRADAPIAASPGATETGQRLDVTG